MFIAPHYPLAVWGLTSITWLVLWLVLATLTVLLLILLRTRWSQARPWRKCAILSLWVHLLLAVVATTVRIVTGAPETGGDKPIRVVVISVTEVQAEPEEEITPDWEQPEDPALVPPELEPLEAPTLEPLAGPDESVMERIVESEPTPTPPAPPSPVLGPVEAPPDPAAESLVHDTPAHDVSATHSHEQPTDSEPTEANATAEKLAPAELVPTPTAQDKLPLPTTYADRFAEDRDQMVQQRGGSAQTERAVKAALGWLAANQSKNGGWDASRFGAGQERGVVLGQYRNDTGFHADTGVSGLALLVFLGAGHTHRGGPFAREVAAGLEYFRQRQRNDGSLSGEAQLFSRMYCHSMATFAVCEALAMTGDERLKPLAHDAVRYTLAMQHPTDGGWRYRRGDMGDTSQLGWQMMTLKSAELAGIDISAVTWTRVERFLRRVRRGSMGGLAAYRPEAPASRTMTAEAWFCRQLQQTRWSEQSRPGAAQEATDSILQKLPGTAQRNLYFWYYATLALHRNQSNSAEAATAWEAWNHALTTTLLATQQDNGSWTADTVWGGYGGRVYTTALSALCLEVYYRYNPEDTPGEVAGRKGWKSVHR